VGSNAIVGHPGQPSEILFRTDTLLLVTGWMGHKEHNQKHTSLIHHDKCSTDTHARTMIVRQHQGKLSVCRLTVGDTSLIHHDNVRPARTHAR
jgi:hypothetical protein